MSSKLERGKMTPKAIIPGLLTSQSLTLHSFSDGARRALGLDALRGSAIVGMVLSGIIPWNTLPAWMYHVQVPPPTRVFNPNIPGISWVDLVFPYFLFALGAAIPLALSRRLEKGISHLRVIFSIFERGVLLAFFALFVEHVGPWSIMPEPDTNTKLLSILGFALLFMIYVRVPEFLPRWLMWVLRAVGFAGATYFMIKLGNPEGEHFTFHHNDIIIILLTTSAVFGSLTWLLTRKQLLLRLGILGILAALRFSPHNIGWVKAISDAISGQAWLSWVFQIGYLQYLFIIIPGTIVGDMLLNWMRSGRDIETGVPSWSASQFIAIAAVMMAFQIILLAGLFERWGFGCLLVSALLLIVAWLLMPNPGSDMERLLKQLFAWGAYWLVLGLFFEPYEGGIKKDPATMSYYFVTAGMAIFLLIFFMVIIDVFHHRRKLVGLLIDNGQNPMIAYVAMGSLVWPLLSLTGISDWLEVVTPTPWSGFIRGLFMTFLMMLVVSVFTRRKMFWRS